LPQPHGAGGATVSGGGQGASGPAALSCRAAVAQAPGPSVQPNSSSRRSVLAASLGRSTGAGSAGVGGDRQLPEQARQAYMLTYARVDLAYRHPGP
jgi:hypothetical protein